MNWTQPVKIKGWENSKHLAESDLDDQADDITSFLVPNSISARRRSEIGAFLPLAAIQSGTGKLVVSSA